MKPDDFLGKYDYETYYFRFPGKEIPDGSMRAQKNCPFAWLLAGILDSLATDFEYAVKLAQAEFIEIKYEFKWKKCRINKGVPDEVCGCN